MMISDSSRGAPARTGSTRSNGHIEDANNMMNPPCISSSGDGEEARLDLNQSVPINNQASQVILEYDAIDNNEKSLFDDISMISY